MDSAIEFKKELKDITEALVLTSLLCDQLAQKCISLQLSVEKKEEVKTDGRL